MRNFFIVQKTENQFWPEFVEKRKKALGKNKALNNRQYLMHLLTLDGYKVSPHDA